MESFTRTSFGLLIAYFIPGMIALFTMALYRDVDMCNIKLLLDNYSGFIWGMVFFSFAVGTGLIINAFNWIILQKIVFCHIKISSTIYTSKKTEYKENLEATLDENFRYVQFYGNIFLIMPAIEHYFVSRIPFNDPRTVYWVMTTYVCLELVLLLTAREAYSRYVKRLNQLSKGGSNA